MEESRGGRARRFAEIHFRARDIAGKSQEYMAMELGVAKKTVQNWEKGVSSPSFFESLEWFRVLNVNPFPFYMSILYPDKTNKLKHISSDEDINDAFETLIKQISVNDKRALLYLYYGSHGSSPHSLLQLILAHLHTPLKYRITQANSIVSNYTLLEGLNELKDTDKIMPDMDDLKDSIVRANVAVLHNELGYTNLEKMVDK